MITPKISFIVPCYNYGRYLPDCLASIFGQEGEWDFEVIAIDDASTDNTQEVLHSFAGPRLRIITHAVNQGHVKTINEGLLEARGQFVARIDPDDRYRRNYLKLVIPKFAEHAEVGMVYGDVAIINGQGEINIEGGDTVHGGRDFKGNELVRLLAKNFICAPSVMARREAWLKPLPVPEGLAFNDWYFTLMMAHEWEFYYLDAVLADYRVHDTNHHHKVVVNKSEEPSIFWLLDKIYSEPEKSADLEAAKQKAKKSIYAAQYLDMASKYFGCYYNEDARHCFWAAIKRQPLLLLNATVMRHFAATIFGRGLYERLKRPWKTIWRTS